MPRDTRTVATAGGGLHLYFRMPDGVRLTSTAGRLGTHIDTRAGGGYVVAAGSVVNRTHYRTVCAAAPAPVPGWILSMLTPPTRIPGSPHPVTTHAAYVSAALAGEVRNVEGAGPGRRNQTLFVAAARLGRFVSAGRLSVDDVRSALMTAADRHVGVDGFTTDEVRRTIDSALRRGMTSSEELRPTVGPPQQGRRLGRAY